jgi:large subunit ribosomal protein L24
MKIKVGDNVIIRAGKDKGKSGKVIKLFKEKNKVLVEGINIVKKHEKSRKQGVKGQTVDKAMPLHVSNVGIVDAKTGKATRVSYKIEKDKKVRVAQKSGKVI